MNIILNEDEWAEEMIKNHELGSAPAHTLRCIAGYYYNNNYNKKEIRRLLENHLLSCDPSISLVKWSGTLDRILKSVGKRKNINVPGIYVTAPEIETINNISGTQARRLAFTLLCVAKYWDAVSNSNDHWVNTRDRDIVKMANIHTSVKRQSLLYGQLIDAGLIKQSRRIDNLNVKVTFMRAGDKVIHITDFRNLGFQYLKYAGGPYFECQNCGLVIKEKTDGRGPKPKYCPDCAVKVQAQQKVNYVMRQKFSTPKN